MTTSTHTTRIPYFSMLTFAVFILIDVLSPCVSLGQNGDPFVDAVTAFRAGQFDVAKKSFLELETQHPGNPILLLNLGLIANIEKRPGAALALWRKGLVQNPTDEALLNAVDWIKPKLAKSEIARDFDLWEEWRRVLLLRVSPIAMIIVSALLFVLAGWMMLRWWGARRRALEEETAMPSPPVAAAAMTILFLFVFGTSIAIFIDRLEIRGTVLVTKASVLSAPDITATPLFDIFEGMEVVIRESRKVREATWRRVTYPGGNTGWIADRDVLTSADPSDRAFIVKSGDGK